MAIVGFLLLMCLGLYMIFYGARAMYHAFLYTGNMYWVAPNFAAFAIGCAIVIATWMHKPFTIVITLT